MPIEAKAAYYNIDAKIYHIYVKLPKLAEIQFNPRKAENKEEEEYKQQQHQRQARDSHQLDRIMCWLWQKNSIKIKGIESHHNWMVIIGKSKDVGGTRTQRIRRHNYDEKDTNRMCMCACISTR